MNVSEEEIKERLKYVKKRSHANVGGLLKKYANVVGTAHYGALTVER